MKKSIQLTILIVLISSAKVHSQEWLELGNNAINPAIHFLGSVNNAHLQFRTGNIQRLQLNESIAYPINGFAGDRSGFMMLTRDPALLGVGPTPCFTLAELA